MRALTWQGRENVSVEEVQDPVIKEANDAIIRVTSTAICGSDLHLYSTLGMYLDKGDILGHETMGVVQEVGSDAGDLKLGDRVVIPFNISCGHCWMCDRQLYAQCETNQVREHDTGTALFGFTKLYGQVPGGQADYLRVPNADFGPVVVPNDRPDEHWLFLSDILPTAWQAVQFADVAPGGSIAIVGLGPVGQFAVRIARHLGIERIIGIDLVPERLDLAEKYGATTIDLTDVDDLRDAVLTLTNGRGADGVVEAVGMESHGSPIPEFFQKVAVRLPDRVAAAVNERAGMDRLSALHASMLIARRGGTVSIAGVYGGAADPMNMMKMFDRGLTIRMGQCHVRRWTDDIMQVLVGPGDPLGTEDLVTHPLPLEDAPRGYRIFQKKADGCIKVVLKP